MLAWRALDFVLYESIRNFDGKVAKKLVNER